MFNFHAPGVLKNVREVMNEIIKCPKKGKVLWLAYYFKRRFSGSYFFKPKRMVTQMYNMSRVNEGKPLPLWITRCHHSTSELEGTTCVTPTI